MESSGKLQGEVAIVTGAGSSGPGLGTGRAMAVLFAREGAQVVLVDKFEERAKETLHMIESEGGEALIVTADLSDLSEASRIVQAAVSQYGTVDILVNNAAISVLNQPSRHECGVASIGLDRESRRTIHAHEGGRSRHAGGWRWLHRQHLVHRCTPGSGGRRSNRLCLG